MGEIKSPPVAFPIIAIMFTSEKCYIQAIEECKNRLGELLDSGPVYKVSDFTNYYGKEFGTGLHKRLHIFKNPQPLQNFHKIKIWTNDLELSIGEKNNKRIVNLDPGYLESSKLVLYSTKNFSHRIHIGDGIYAELTMIYEHGKFKFLPWTYPDYLWDENVKFLLEVRSKIVKVLRNKVDAQ
jgi:hypothetical protein